MTWTEVEEQWSQLQRQAQSKWTKLSHDDLASVSGNRARLIAKLEERYGLTTAEGEQHVDEWSSHEATGAWRA